MLFLFVKYCYGKTLFDNAIFELCVEYLVDKTLFLMIIVLLNECENVDSVLEFCYDVSSLIKKNI